MDCCPAQLYAVVVCLFVLLSGICALTGYTYYVHARLDAMHAICAKLELSMQPNSQLNFIVTYVQPKYS